MSGHEDYATAWELFGANQSGSGGAEGPVEEPAEALSAALSRASSGSPRFLPRDAAQEVEETTAPEVRSGAVGPEPPGIPAALSGHASELE